MYVVTGCILEMVHARYMITFMSKDALTVKNLVILVRSVMCQLLFVVTVLVLMKPDLVNINTIQFRMNNVVLIVRTPVILLTRTIVSILLTHWNALFSRLKNPNSNALSLFIKRSNWQHRAAFPMHQVDGFQLQITQ